MNSSWGKKGNNWVKRVFPHFFFFAYPDEDNRVGEVNSCWVYKLLAADECLGSEDIF